MLVLALKFSRDDEGRPLRGASRSDLGQRSSRGDDVAQRGCEALPQNGTESFLNGMEPAGGRRSSTLRRSKGLSTRFDVQ
jgi:hypothetical protein